MRKNDEGEISITIKRQLAISNLLMLLIPAILILLIVGATAGILVLYNHGTIGDLGENQESVTVARDLITYYLQEAGSEDQEDSLSILMDRLNGIEFHLQLVRNGAIVASNLTQEDVEAIRRIPRPFSRLDQPLILAIGKIAVVQDSVLIDGTPVTLTAVNSSVEMAGTLGSTFRQILQRYFLLVLAAFLLIITASNMLLTSRVSRRVLIPLAALSDSARRIRDGNLDFSISYNRRDEFSGVFEDFDAMRQRLSDSVQQQLRYEEERREFIAEMSHDLRTPLTAIQGYVEGLRDGIASTPEKQAHYLNMIYHKVRGMDLLVDRLFLLSKLETGHFPFRFESVDLVNFLCKYCEDVREEYASKGQTVRFETEEASPVTVPLDAEQMRQVLENLLENSVKYRRGDTGISTVRLTAESGRAVVTISDDGPGVGEEDLSRLFESFYRGDKARTNPGEGSGLGLAIVRRIIEAHGGSISACSHNGLSIQILFNREETP